MKILLIIMGVCAMVAWRVLLSVQSLGYTGLGIVLPKSWRDRLAFAKVPHK